MEVVLLEDVKNLGSQGEVKKVADGYARNYLIPHRLARVATAQALKEIEVVRKKRIAQEAKRKADCQEKARMIEQASVTISMKAQPDQTLYGSVSEPAIVEALRKEHEIEIAAEMLVIAEPIKKLGSHSVAVKLHPEVETTLKVWVVEE